MRDQAAPEYLIDISHPASSSSQASTCSVEPGCAEDVSKIVSYPDPIHRLLLTHVPNSYVSWGQAERLLQ